ncbi:MAG: methyltransferase domain-containing protein [Clostridiales bacterium]|nr:methyltransferase domain-containing protein [Clostridiales bacterium]
MNQEPFINWKALSGIHMAQRPPVRPENGVNMWDLESARYNKMSALEKELTVKQVDALPLSPEDTVLDMGCGCGRLSVPIAQRVKAVTSLDSSEKMLANCAANAKAAGAENLTPLFLDFFEAEAGVNVPVHDLVFCSRSAAIWEIEKLCTFARKYVNMWDLESARYNKMSALEKELTVKQVDALPLSPEDTVLDMGCGCGRLSVPIAQRVKAVTSLDSSEKMLANCAANAKAAGAENLTPLFLDFFEAEAGVNVPVHDLVFCSRSAAIWEIEKLCTFARKYVAVLIFANAPSLPELLGKLFSGTTEKPAERGPHRIHDRRLDYNALWNTVYDLGYEPNCTIVPDGFTASYASVEEACDDLRMLGTVDPDREETYRKNVMQFLTRREDGSWDLLIPTRTAVIWWEVHPEKF